MSDVIIYTRSFCGFCTAAKALLQRKKIPFQEIDATAFPEKREEMIQRSGHFTFPQIFIDGRHIGGCDDLHTLEARGDLDRLLEPASAA